MVREIFGVKYQSQRYMFFPKSLGSLEAQYELGVINGIKHCYNLILKQTIEVVQIGGGNGITSVIHANSPEIRVNLTIIEPSFSQIRKIKKAFELNNINNITILQKFVGNNNAWGEDLALEELPIKQLPFCDILEIDCEGSEKIILENLTMFPNYIIIEIHHTIIKENNGWIYSFSEFNNYDIQYLSGHNGVCLTHHEFEELSTIILSSNDMTAKKFGARGPLVIALVKKDV